MGYIFIVSKRGCRPIEDGVWLGFLML